MSDVARPEPGAQKLPARELSSEQVEAVVRRALELQAHETQSAHADTSGGVSGDELVRIGGELGIPAGHMRQALIEVTSNTPEPASGAFGPARVSASRAVPGNADTVRAHIEQYLLQSEYLAVVRRLRDRTIYEKAGGFQVEVIRVMDATRGALSGQRTPRIGTGFDMRSGRTVEVAVSPVDDTHCWVTFVIDLNNQRLGLWAGMGASGTAVAAVTGFAASVMIAPPAALVALPVLAGSLAGTRAVYMSIARRARIHLEALLDHLERGESLTGA